MSIPESHDDKKEHLKMHLALLDSAKKTLDGNQPLKELTSKMMEVRSKTHNHHMSVLCIAQFGDKAAK